MHTKRQAKNAERRWRGAESSIRGDASEMKGPAPIPATIRKKRSIENEDESAVPKLPAVAKRMPTPTRRRALVELLR